MRDTIIGILIGLIITIAIALLEAYKMAINALWTFLGIAIVLVVLLILWRPFLKVIYKRNFGLWLRINRLFESPNPDDVSKKVAEWEAKKEAKKHERNKSAK